MRRGQPVQLGVLGIEIGGVLIPQISARHSGGSQAEPLFLGVDRQDPDQDAGANEPGLLRRETGEAVGLDERAERHLLGHDAIDDVADLVTGKKILPTPAR